MSQPKSQRKWVTTFRNVATRKMKERKINFKEKKSASKIMKPWFEKRLEPLATSRFAQFFPFLRREPTTGQRIMTVNDRQANEPHHFRNNSISTTKYGIFTFIPKNLFEVRGFALPPKKNSFPLTCALWSSNSNAWRICGS